jgi:hypothetical protein
MRLNMPEQVQERPVPWKPGRSRVLRWRFLGARRGESASTYVVTCAIALVSARSANLKWRARKHAWNVWNMTSHPVVLVVGERYEWRERQWTPRTHFLSLPRAAT